MTRYKYNIGDYLGVEKNILFVERCSEIADARGRRPWGIFKCPECGQNFRTYIKSITDGKKKCCNDCGLIHKSQRMLGNKFGEKNGSDLIGKRFGSWTVIDRDEERQNGHLVWTCQCDCGEIGHVTTCNLTQNISTRCIVCASKDNVSQGVKKIIDVLTELNIEFCVEKTFDDCKYKNKLRFDFYLPEYNTCIEYDGEQHYIDTGYFEDSLENLRERDEIKNQYCKDNNINLIRIPYWDKNKITSLYIEEKLRRWCGDARFKNGN